MSQFKELPFDQLYEVHEIIGSGQFATVRRCIDKNSGREFAAKFIKKRRTTGRTSRLGVPLDDVIREINILRELNHENIIKLYDAFQNNQEAILVLELVKGGELFEYITTKDNLNDEEASLFIKQILLGLEHLHNKNIAHLDLKPENVMLCDADSCQIKLIDFGLSRKITSKEVKGLYGTPEFVAPEIINYDPISTATDMWSVGCIAYLLLSGSSPFLGDTKQETFENISTFDWTFYDEYFSNINYEAKDFISHLLIKDQRKRYSVTQCLNHPWIKRNKSIKSIRNEPPNLILVNFKSANAKHQWKHAFRIVVLCNRLSKSAKQNSRNHGLNQSGASTMSSLVTVQQEVKHSYYEQDENFISAAIFAAIEEENINGIRELFSMSNVNPNQSNKHGESLLHYSAGLGHLEILKFLHSKGANINLVDDRGDSIVHWAARQNHPQIIRYLYDHGASVDQQNKSLETPLHVAARYGHAESIEQLCKCGANVNAIDEHGETALIISVWHGFPKIVHILGEVGAKSDLRNKDGESAIHVASTRGHIECVKCLLENGVNLNLLDKNHHTSLHLALKRQHVGVAIILLRAGCDFEIVDGQGERAIHYAARSNHLEICQSLCALGCNVNVPNKIGLTPLHLAAKNGHIEIVRCLCLAGCKIDPKNRDGIIPEISATAQSHLDIADLLNRLRNEQLREEYIAQLVPTYQSIQRVKLKVFGHSGAGKSTLIDSLKCGYFSSWFRRSSKASTQTTNRRLSEETTHDLVNSNSTGFLNFHNSSSQDYTKGIDCQQVNISGIGDLSIWEFSGHESYYQIYDHFIGNTNCYHAIIFSLYDPLDIQIQKVRFWLDFLQSRLPIQEPLLQCGKSSHAAKVILIGTHADLINSNNNNEINNCDGQMIIQEIINEYGNIFDIYEHLIALDANVVGSASMKQLKQYLSSNKTNVIQGVPFTTGFLDAVMTFINICRKAVLTFPVLLWSQFKEMLRTQVNPLASEDHLKELVQQLQVMGEIIYIKGKTSSLDQIVINPAWFTVDIIGNLLNHEYINKNRVNGSYSVDDIQMLFPETDALDLLQTLESISLCAQCDHESDIGYEFACFNMLEPFDGIWDKFDSQNSDYVYSGICFQTDKNIENNLSLLCIFPRIQISLRQAMTKFNDLAENDLYQWSKGSKLTVGSLEALISQSSLNNLHSYSAIDIKVRGPIDLKNDCFLFMDNILCIIEETLYEICPGMTTKKSYYSPQHLKEHKEFPSIYSNSSLIKKLLEFESNCDLKIKVDSEDYLVKESIADIICFGIHDLSSIVETNKFYDIKTFHSYFDQQNISSQSTHQTNMGPMLAPDLHCSNLSLLTKQKLCAILDPPEPIGRDWCMLGILLGMTDKLPKLDPGNNNCLSPASRIFDECIREANCSISALVKKLEKLARHDAVEVILENAPLLRIFPSSSQPEDVHLNDESNITSSGVSSGSHTSSSNLSR